jgi:ATP synthase protein I
MFLVFYNILFKTIGLQAVLISITSIMVAFKISTNAGFSFLFGGLISMIPIYLFGRIFFRQTGAKVSRKIANAFYIGETVKWLSTALLFIFIFQWPGLHALSLFLGFISAQLIYGLLLFNAKA